MSTSVSGDGDEKFQISIREDTGRDVETPSDTSKSGFTAEDERRLVRKLDMRIMPTVCLIYLFACECLPSSPQSNSLFIVLPPSFLLDLDRTNLGNARLQGLPKDVLGGDPTGVLFDWVNSAFFFSYVCFLPWTLYITPTHAWGRCRSFVLSQLRSYQNYSLLAFGSEAHRSDGAFARYSWYVPLRATFSSAR